MQSSDIDDSLKHPYYQLTYNSYLCEIITSSSHVTKDSQSWCNHRISFFQEWQHNFWDSSFLGQSYLLIWSISEVR